MNRTTEQLEVNYLKLKKMFEERRLHSLEDRIKCLKALKQSIKENEEQIYKALFEDLGKSNFESFITEISLIYSEIDYFLKNMKNLIGKRAIKTPLLFQWGKTYLEYVPKGVVLIISPWNYPIQLSLMPLIASIAAGNASLVKPSDVSLNSSLVLEKILNNMKDWPIKIILGNKEIVDKLLDKPWGHIFYTGSTQTGKHIMQRAAESLTPLTLELGGKSPVIIDETADLKIAARRIMWGKCLNAGQTCIGPDYVLLKEEMIQPFVNLVEEFLRESFNNINENENYGRIINEHHLKRLIDYLSYGKILLGGNYSIKDKFLEPTLITDIKINSPLWVDEIFGPILSIIPYKNIDEAIKFIREKPTPLVIYMFSNNKKIIKEVKNNTLSGSFVINDVVTFLGIKNLPFGGVGFSGMGQYHGEYGYYNLSHLRPCYYRSDFFDPAWRYPPYSDKVKKLLKILL